MITKLPYEMTVQMIPEANVVVDGAEGAARFPLGDTFRSLRRQLYFRLAVDAEVLSDVARLDAGLRREITATMSELGQYLQSDEWIDQLHSSIFEMFAGVAAVAE